MRQTYLKRLFKVVFFGLSFSATAQTNSALDSAAIYNLPFEELLKLQGTEVSSDLEKLINSLIGVATNKALSARKSPSIISYITREEIQNSGARDLIDLLRMVPGFDLAADVTGAVGIGVRGNWAQEGKVLLLIDGQEMNDGYYASNQLGNHYSVDQIEKIEIIRGPGSAVYGGYAEYGVINIITLKGDEINGVSVSGTYGQMEKIYARRNGNLAIGKKINKTDVSLKMFYGQGNRSDADYTDIYGGSYNMAGNGNLNPANINLGISNKNLSVRAIVDQYNTTTQNFYSTNLSKPYDNNNLAYFFETKYTFKLSDKLTITPKYNFKRQIPWSFNGSIEDADTAEVQVYNKQIDRQRFNLTASYDLNKKINFLAGGEMYYDFGKVLAGDDEVFSNGSSEVNFNNIAVFAQSIIKNKIVNLTLGARYDQHNVAGSAFVPRVGLTKKINDLNLKLLFSNSFRAPSVSNINNSLNGKITPEKSQVTELEASYHLDKNSILTVNVFDILTRKPIIYSIDTTTGVVLDVYKNSTNIGSDGIEAEYKYKEKWGYIFANYSYYTTQYKPTIADYEVPGVKGISLAFPTHKATLNASINVYKGLSLNPSVVFYSSRYGISAIDSAGEYVYTKFDPTALVNFYVNWNNIGKSGLTLGLGCYDILNVKYSFIQAYNGGYAPLPQPTREVVFKLSYNLNFKKKK